MLLLQKRCVLVLVWYLCPCLHLCPGRTSIQDKLLKKSVYMYLAEKVKTKTKMAFGIGLGQLAEVISKLACILCV